MKKALQLAGECAKALFYLLRLPLYRRMYKLHSARYYGQLNKSLEKGTA